MGVATSTKKFFVIKFDHCIDIITNSSSELFVLENEEDTIITELVESIYPNFRSEYREPQSLRECSDYDLESYLREEVLPVGYYMRGKKPSEYKLIDGFTFNELYEPGHYQTGKGPLDYEIRDSILSIENRDKIVNAIDPRGKIYLMFSHDDNPNWDYQEKLMEIGTRHHLG